MASLMFRRSPRDFWKALLEGLLSLGWPHITSMWLRTSSKHEQGSSCHIGRFIEPISMQVKTYSKPNLQVANPLLFPCQIKEAQQHITLTWLAGVKYHISHSLFSMNFPELSDKFIACKIFFSVPLNGKHLLSRIFR